MRNRFIIALMIVFCGVGFSGCGSDEVKPIGVDVLSQLQAGETTRAETIELLGQPDWVSRGSEGQNELLCYESQRFKQSALDWLLRSMTFQEHEQLKAVNLVFDESNVLSEISMRD